MEKIKKFLSREPFSNILSPIIAILMGLLFGLIILLISNPSNAMGGFLKILSGGFAGGAKGIGDVFYYATPIILTGLSVGFAFKTGLFNIGASGQFIVGAYFAVYVGLTWTFLPPSIHWIVAVLAGLVGGAIWGLIPGILKAFCNVNEVIATIMMNYIGLFMVNSLVRANPIIFDQLKNRSKTPLPSAILPKLGLDKIFGASSINIGIFIAILFVIIIHILINKTTFGYELKACGHNPQASQYAGINHKRNITLSMTIAGSLAGLAGALVMLAGSGKHIEVVDILPIEGFNGIPVALLGLSNPFGVLIAGLFIAYLGQGGFYLQLYDFAPEIIDMIIASIVYFSAFSFIIKYFLQHKKSNKNIDDNPLETNNEDVILNITANSNIDKEDEN